jgi:hypothetical protein
MSSRTEEIRWQSGGILAARPTGSIPTDIRQQWQLSHFTERLSETKTYVDSRCERLRLITKNIPEIRFIPANSFVPLHSAQAM